MDHACCGLERAKQKSAKLLDAFQCFHVYKVRSNLMHNIISSWRHVSVSEHKDGDFFITMRSQAFASQARAAQLLWALRCAVLLQTVLSAWVRWIMWNAQKIIYRKL